MTIVCGNGNNDGGHRPPTTTSSSHIHQKPYIVFKRDNQPKSTCTSIRKMVTRRPPHQLSTSSSSTKSLSTSTTSTVNPHCNYFQTKPKLVALLRGSCRSLRPSLRPTRRVFRFVISHRITQNYEQFLNEVSECVKLDIGAVHKIYGLTSSKKITCLNDLIDEECVYLVYGRSEQCSSNDFLLDEIEERDICSILGHPFDSQKPFKKEKFMSNSLKINKKVRISNAIHDSNIDKNDNNNNNPNLLPKKCNFYKIDNHRNRKNLSKSYENGNNHGKFIESDDEDNQTVSLHCDIGRSTDKFCKNDGNNHNSGSVSLSASISSSVNIKTEHFSQKKTKNKQLKTNKPNKIVNKAPQNGSNTSLVFSNDYNCDDNENKYLSKSTKELSLKLSNGHQQQQQKQQELPKLNQIPPATKFQPKKEVDDVYFVDKSIGDGIFGVVYTCVHRQTRQVYAMKVVDKLAMQKVLGDPNDSNGTNSEIAILGSVKHPNIVQLFDHFEYVDQSYLILELLQGGDLFDSITMEGKYSEKESALMITDLLNALNYLHRLHIVHRDIKLENLLVSFVPIFPTNNDNSNKKKSTSIYDKQYRKIIKLADFGLAVQIKPGQKLFTVCGTPSYVAPEIILEAGYSYPVDIWAAGVILYMLLSGIRPFNNCDEQDTVADDEQMMLFNRIILGEYEFHEQLWSDISVNAKRMIQAMLSLHQTERITAQQALEHAWLKQFNFSKKF